jgi:sigma-70-like protein
MIERAAVAGSVNELQVALATDAAFETWYRRTLPRVYSYLLSRCGKDPTLAEELTQQTFIAAIDRRSRYDGRSDTVNGRDRHLLAATALNENGPFWGTLPTR